MSATDTSTFTGPPPPPKVNHVARLLGVFHSPGETFADIAKAPTFWLPMLLLTVLGAATFIAAAQRIGPEQLVRKEMARFADRIPPERLQEAVDRSVRFFWTRYAAVFVVSPIIFLAAAGVILILANFVFGGSSSFKQMVAVVTHGWLPGGLSALVGIVVIFLKAPEDIDLQNLIAANLGVIVPSETSKFLHAVATSLDLFVFWQIFLIATGVAATAKLSFTKSLIAVLIPWVLLVLIKSAVVAAFT